MRSRRFLLSLLSVFLCLSILFSASFSVSAAIDSSDAAVNLDNFYIATADPIEENLISVPATWNSSTGYLTENTTDSYIRLGFAADFETNAYVRIDDAGKYFYIDVILRDIIASGSLLQTDVYYHKLLITTSDGLQYEMTPNYSYQPDAGQWNARYICTVEGNTPLYLNELYFICNLPSSTYGLDPYDLYFDFYLAPREYDDVYTTNQVINTINTSTNQVISAINGQAQEIKDAINTAAGELHKDNLNILQRLQSILTALGQLPQKIWDLIEDGLQNLFIPDEEYIKGYKDKWDKLLSERFGAVYQSVNIMHSFYDDVMSAKETQTIDFPKVTIPLLDGDEFTFGGWTVDIIPDGFEQIIGILKLVIGTVCTLVFINGLRNKYEKILEGYH